MGNIQKVCQSIREFFAGRPEQLSDPACRDWVSEAEWREAVNEVRSPAKGSSQTDRRDDRSPRFSAVTRCLLRVERRGEVLGMLLVSSRNLSATGMCVVHGGRIPRYSKATILIENAAGRGILTTGTTVWCHRVKGSQPRVHEIGISFDAAIDVSGFAPETQPEAQPDSQPDAAPDAPSAEQVAA